MEEAISLLKRIKAALNNLPHLPDETIRRKDEHLHDDLNKFLEEHGKDHIADTSKMIFEPELARHQPCGCVVCSCENQVQCLGCGSKHCGTHELGVFTNPVFVDHIADASKMVSLRDYLAMQAAKEFMSGGGYQDWEDMAHDAYRFADKMIAARGEK